MTRKTKNNAGFVTALAVSVALAVLIFFGGLYHVISNSTRENIVIDLRDQSTSVANSAVQQVINIIRANPNLADLDSKMVDTDDNPLPNPPANGLPDSNGFFDVYHRSAMKDLREDDDDLIGRYFAKAKKINVDIGAWNNSTNKIFLGENNLPVSGEIFMIVAEGRAVNKKGVEQPPSTSYAFVTLSNVGDYFCAVRGQLTVLAGAKLGTGKIYGRNLVFDSAMAGPAVAGPADAVAVMGEANYDVEASPIDWPDVPAGGLDDRAGRVYIAGPPEPSRIVVSGDTSYGYRPKQLQSPLVFPSINEQIDFYRETIHSSQWADVLPDEGAATCSFDGVTIRPPSVYTENSYPKTNNNKDHVFYCDGTGGVFIRNVDIDGQVIIVAKGPVRIGGDIRIPDTAAPLSGRDGTYTNPPDLGPGDCTTCPNTPTGVPSRANQLVVYAGAGVVIDKNWCDGGNNHLELQGLLIISPDAGLVYDPTAGAGDCVSYTSYSLDFQGAMYLSDQPTLGDVFTKPESAAPDSGRKYRYLETLQSDPPPVRQSFTIHRQFTIRRPSPVASPTPY